MFLSETGRIQALQEVRHSRVGWPPIQNNDEKSKLRSRQQAACIELVEALLELSEERRKCGMKNV